MFIVLKKVIMPSVPNGNKRLRVAYTCFTQSTPPVPIVERMDAKKFQVHLPSVKSVLVEETNKNVENLSRYL